MNKQLLQTVSILLFTLISTVVFGQKELKYDKAYFDKFPSYEMVIEAYFEANEFSVRAVNKMKFAKKYNGWYVIFLNRNLVEIEERLIWNAQSASFQNIKTDKTETGGITDIQKAKEYFIYGFDPMWFEQYPVYGYHGYEDDVILLLENEENLTVEALDALARSYSSKSMETINPGQFGGKVKIMEYDRTFNPKDWEDEVLNQFIFYADKSIATYKKLSDEYPDYQTVVGNIKTKYRNEFMAAYYALKYSGKPDLGKKYLIDDLYSEFQIKTAINYLKTCATNAILFTYGDNDTYPLIYAQDKLGIRTDVKVINTSLSSLGRYIHFLKTTYNLSTTLSMDDYKLDNNNYMLVKDEIEEVELRDFFKAISEDKDLYMDEYSNVHYFPSAQGFFVIQVKSLGYQLGVAKRLSESAVRLKINRNYLIKGEFFILDLITTDNWQTPIYFTLGSYQMFNILGLQDYLEVEGLAYRFLPKDAHDFTLLETNLSYNFKYQEDNTIDWFSGSNYLHLNYYHAAFLNLLIYQENNIQKAEKTLDKMESVFPHEVISYKYRASEFADFCYRRELTERGDAFIRNETRHVHNYFKNIENKETLSHFDKQSIKNMLFTINQLVTITDINDRTEFENLANDFEKYLIKYGD